MKRSLDSTGGTSASDANADMTNPVPRSLKMESVLRNDPDDKTAFVLCSNGGESQSIVIINKKPLSENDIKAIVEGADTELSEYQRNGQYSKYNGRPPPEMNEVDMTFICPAGEKEIAKYSEQKRYAVRETPAIYTAATVPYRDAIPASFCDWVKNIVIDRAEEMDKLLYEDDGCMLLPGEETAAP